MVVLHSRYQRNAHLPYEFLYFFEIEANEALKEQLFTQDQLRRLDPAEAEILEDRPAWFVPEPLDSYDIWGFAEERTRNFVC